MTSIRKAHRHINALSRFWRRYDGPGIIFGSPAFDRAVLRHDRAMTARVFNTRPERKRDVADEKWLARWKKSKGIK